MGQSFLLEAGGALAREGLVTSLRASAGNHILESLELEELFWLRGGAHQFLLDRVVGVGLSICQRDLSGAPRALLNLVDVFALHLSGRHLTEVVCEDVTHGSLNTKRLSVGVLLMRQLNRTVTNLLGLGLDVVLCSNSTVGLNSKKQVRQSCGELTAALVAPFAKTILFSLLKSWPSTFLYRPSSFSSRYW